MAWVWVPAATASTQGATALLFMVISSPSLPWAKTTTIPASAAALVALLTGSWGLKGWNDPPKELLTTRMPYWSLWATIQS